MWEHTGRRRPGFAVPPGPGEESVWDYPRPPRLETRVCEVRVSHAGRLLARAERVLRVLETASPPGIYLPMDGVDWQRLVASSGASFCEWKGAARYWSLADDPGGPPVAWAYEQPTARFAALRGHLSFYPGRVHCELDGEPVRAQDGGFYGGWISRGIVGPFKGTAGTGHW